MSGWSLIPILAVFFGALTVIVIHGIQANRAIEQLREEHQQWQQANMYAFQQAVQCVLDEQRELKNGNGEGAGHGEAREHQADRDRVRWRKSPEGGAGQARPHDDGSGD